MLSALRALRPSRFGAEASGRRRMVLIATAAALALGGYGAAQIRADRKSVV